MAAVVVMSLTGCTIPTSTVEGSAVAERAPEAVVESTTPLVPAEPRIHLPLPASGAQVIRDEFATVATAHPGRLGLAYMPVGGGQVQVLGDWSSGVAWSTIKVPLAVAAMRASGSAELPSATSAIVESDNAAAEDLWASLGDAPTAAASVEQVLLDGGDPSTVVQKEPIRSGYSSFGQTDWPLARQTQFASELQCVDFGAAIVELMKQISPHQSWGLGRIPGAAFKGGWGPGEDGSYLVRQLGIIDVADGSMAVAIAAEPDSGSFDDGTVMLDAVAEMLASNTSSLPYGRCI